MRSSLLHPLGPKPPGHGQAPPVKPAVGILPYRVPFPMQNSDALGSLTASEVMLELGGPLAPGVVKIVGDDSYLHVVMPLRIPA